MVRKMALIPADMASQMNQHLPVAPDLRHLSSLDQEMMSILSDKAIPTDLKFKQYFNTLRRYDTAQENAFRESRTPALPQTPAAAAVKLPDSLPVDEKDILDNVPKPYHRSTRLLLNYIRKNKDISWNDASELVVKGKRVPHSNIFDLVTDLSRERQGHTPPAGWKPFLSALIDQNIPKDAIGNKKKHKYVVRHAIDSDDDDEEAGTSYGTASGSSTPFAQQARTKKFRHKLMFTNSGRKNQSGSGGLRKLPWKKKKKIVKDKIRWLTL